MSKAYSPSQRYCTQLEIVWPCTLYILLKTKHKSFYTEEMCNLSNSYALENSLYCRGVVVFCSLRYPIFFGPSESAFPRYAGVVYLWPELYAMPYVAKSLLKRIINVARWRVRTGKLVCLGRYERLINENHFTSVALIANTLVSGGKAYRERMHICKFLSNFKKCSICIYLLILDCYFLVTTKGIMRIALNYKKRFSYYYYYLLDGNLKFIHFLNCVSWYISFGRRLSFCVLL